MEEKSKKSRVELVDAIYDEIIEKYQSEDKNCLVLKKDVSFILDSLLENIKNSVRDGDVVEIRKFGTFYRKFRKGKDNARNVYKGELCSTEDHYSPAFKPGRDFKNLLRDKKVK